MEHRITYRKDGTTYQIISTMEYEGKDETYTAMSDLVGLPLGVTCKLFFLGKLPPVTKPIPVEPGIYLPVLELLKHAGVKFNDRKIVLEQA
jgi:saccharopine dehydrogenase (NAD+, L-glutamate forming)